MVSWPRAGKIRRAGPVARRAATTCRCRSWHRPERRFQTPGAVSSPATRESSRGVKATTARAVKAARRVPRVANVAAAWYEPRPMAGRHSPVMDGGTASLGTAPGIPRHSSAHATLWAAPCAATSSRAVRRCSWPGGSSSPPTVCLPASLLSPLRSIRALSSNGAENRRKPAHGSSGVTARGSRSGRSSPRATVSGSVKA